MTLSVGDTLPEATFFELTDDGLEKVTTSEVFGGRKVALFGVPGAYTPTCHMKHMPGFIAAADDFKAKGCDAVVCVTVNDAHVSGAWAKDTGAAGTVRVISDSTAEFTKAAGLDFDASAVGLMTRSKRFSALVDDGVVKAINIEDVPSEAEATSAENLLKAL